MKLSVHIFVLCVGIRLMKLIVHMVVCVGIRLMKLCVHIVV